MKYKFISLAMALALALGSLAGCAKGGDTSAPAAAADSSRPISSGNAGEPAVTSDRAGDPITPPPQANRIISTAASNTEILVGLGLGDKLVAVDKYSADIPGVPAGIPHVDFQNPDAEALLAARPDLVVTTSQTPPGSADPFAPLKQSGICVACLPTSESIDGILGDITFLAALTGARDAGKKTTDDYAARVAKIKAVGDTITDKKTVYFEIGSGSALYSFGKGTFLNEFIETAGAVNIFGGEQGWISPSPEAVVAANPDVIFTNEDYKGEAQAIADIRGRDGWGAIDAVRNNRIYVVSANESSRPSQNSILALEAIARAVYPDRYP